MSTLLARTRLAAALVAALAVLAFACGRRPGFTPEIARDQLARAFGQGGDQVSIYEDNPGREADTWIVAFKIDGFAPLLEARFAATEDAWELQDVREAPIGNSDPPWGGVAALTGRVRSQGATKAEATMARMTDLASLIERYFTDHGRYPDVELDVFGKLALEAQYLATWQHEDDGWGRRFAYHVSPDGESYIIVSAGADGKFDEPVETYFAKTDVGDEVYAGAGADPDADLIYATGSFVQSFAPER